MSPILWRASLRHLRRHPWQLILAVLGVGLGVAVMVAIDVASGSAQRAFELSSSTVTGEATHLVEGGVRGLPAELYRQVRLDLGVRSSAPVVEGYVAPVARPDRTLRLLGIDPFAEGPFRSFVGRNAATDLDLATFLTQPGSALLDRATASELGIERGESFAIDIGGQIRNASLMGYLETDEEARRPALADLLVVDIATAQELLDIGDRLTRIDLQIPEGDEGEQTLETIRQLLPGDVTVDTAAARAGAAAQMTRAFRLNLQALSLLGLLCGAFLIYNTMTFAVVQRRQLLATLRALGTTRRQILTLILGEAVLVGLLGVLLGGIAGWLLGNGLVAMVTRTINDLYFVLNVREVEVSIGTLAKGALVGLAATITAALAPSWEASATAPRTALTRSELEARIHRALPKASLLGLVTIGLGVVQLLLPTQSLLPAFAGLFSVLLGLALLTPLATVGFMAALTPAAGLVFGQLGRVATRGVAAALSRTGIAVAALTVALSVTVGVDLMIRSFRSTVSGWLEYTLPADFYISVFTTQARRYSAAGSTLDPELFDRLQSLDEVAGANALRHFTASFQGVETPAIAIDLDPLARGVFNFKEGEPDAAWRPFSAGEAVIVSEPLAFRTGVTAGDRIEIATPRGPYPVTVAGVYYDYSSERGVLFLDLDLYRRLWVDDRLTAMSVHAVAGADLSRLEDSVRATLGPGNRLQILSNHELRARSLEVFDRTFVVTGVLRTLAVVVAFVGVLSSLMALQLERTRELGVLRACGLTPGQLWRLVTQQTGLMGLIAGLLSLPTGIIMAAIMIFIINRRSFGWSLQMIIAPPTLWQALLVAVGAALLAGAYPAWRMARTSPAESLREE